MQGKFQDKMALLKQAINEKQARNNENVQQNKIAHTHSHVQIKLDDCRQTRNDLVIQQPIIIQKKQTKISSARKQTPKSNEGSSSNVRTMKNKTTVIQKRQIQAFKPIEIPVFDKKIDLKTINLPSDTGCGNKQIQIKIEKDDTKDKECLKKLFKKIHKLTEELAEAQKQNMKLKVQLENYKNVSKTCNGHQKTIMKLEGDNYRLEVDLNAIKKLLKQKDDQIKRLASQVPKEIIKQVVIEKPVEVVIEVPKHVPGPERIVEKVIEVPKYIEVQKKIPIQPAYEPPRQIVKTVEIPTIVEKPVYIDKPIYVDRPIEVERRVEVPIQMPPIEVPIYIDRPVIPQQYELKIDHLERQIEELIRANDTLCHENSEMRFTIQKLTANLQILSRHNHEKNRETELLMQNSFDYYPISPGVDLSGGSIRYSVSSHPHTRVI